MTILNSIAALFVVGFTAQAPVAKGEDALIAVATNFIVPMHALEADFEDRHPHQITIVAGSTGKLFAQIRNGAPFDVFLSADAARPQILAETDGAVAEPPFTYAVGQLALWSPADPTTSSSLIDQIKRGEFRRLAIANPKLAPYGAAAIEALTALDLDETVRPKLAMGENIGQAFAMVASGAADVGFVAASHLAAQSERRGTAWPVPTDLHAPIRQDAVLLARGGANPAARAFFDYLKSDAAAGIVAMFGYQRP